MVDYGGLGSIGNPGAWCDFSLHRGRNLLIILVK
jgi:hypothetical protein